MKPATLEYYTQGHTAKFQRPQGYKFISLFIYPISNQNLEFVVTRLN